MAFASLAGNLGPNRDIALSKTYARSGKPAEKISEPIDGSTRSRDAPRSDPRTIQVARARTGRNIIVTVLTNRWRVTDDPIQWILEVRKGGKRQKASGWRGRSFCRSRTSLQRCIRELCGAVDAAALDIIDGLPDWHIDRDRPDTAKGAQSHG
jgi:hypothetical protein